MDMRLERETAGQEKRRCAVAIHCNSSAEKLWEIHTLGRSVNAAGARARKRRRPYLQVKVQGRRSERKKQ